MSNASTAYDRIRSTTAATLSTHTELVNPYLIEEDSDLILDKAFAIQCSTGTNAEIQINKLGVIWDYSITIVRRVFQTDRNPSLRIDGEKALMDDWTDVHVALLEDGTLHGGLVTNLAFTAHGGIELLEGDRFGFLLLSSIVSATILEDIDC